MASDLEEALSYQLFLHSYLGWFREYRFCDNRKWSIDFYSPDHRFGVEVEGGTWIKGRHGTGAGFEKDCEKYLAAMEHGITVLRVTGKMVKDGTAIRAIGRFLQNGSSASPAEKLCHALPKKARRTGAGTRPAPGRSGRKASPRRRPALGTRPATRSRRRQGT